MKELEGLYSLSIFAIADIIVNREPQVKMVLMERLRLLHYFNYTT